MCSHVSTVSVVVFCSPLQPSPRGEGEPYTQDSSGLPGGKPHFKDCIRVRFHVSPSPSLFLSHSHQGWMRLSFSCVHSLSPSLPVLHRSPTHSQTPTYLQKACVAVSSYRTACRHSPFPGTFSLRLSRGSTSLWSHSDQTSGCPVERWREEERCMDEWRFRARERKKI